MRHPIVILFILLSHALFGNKVSKGVIDLSKEKLTDNIHNLDGDWLFSWDSNFNEFTPTQTSTVPGFWNSKKNGGFSTFGQAVYRVKVILPENKVKLALRINNIHNAYQLYLGDSLLHEHGKTSKIEAEQIADWSPFLLPIRPKSNTFELTFVVSNFGHRNAGFASSIYIGDYEKMIKDREFRMSIDALIIGGVFVLGIFLLGMYFLWQKEKSLLYFLAFTLIFGFWISFRDEKVFFSLWKSFNWELALRLEYGALIGSISIFTVYISALFPKFNIKFIQRLVLTLNAIALSLVLFAPTHIFTFVAYNNIFTLITSMSYITIVFIRSIKSKEHNNVFTSIALFILFTLIILKISSFLSVFPVNNTLTDLLTLLFVFAMGLIFASRFSGVFNSVVFLKNKAIQQQKDLKIKNKEILASIQYAKHLQSTILPAPSQVKSIFKKSFIFFEPKDIVSGDFYWVEQHNDLVYFAVADCTGHGVPGAMVSFVCSNALSKAIVEENISSPNLILDRTREIVIKQFSTSETSLNDGMDISLGVYNPSSKTLEWAGANNPILVIKKDSESITEIRGNKQPIGKYVNDLTPFDSHSMQLNEGDRIYLFSDGYIDQFGGENGKKFKSNNLKKLILNIQNSPIETHHSKLSQAFYDWQGDFEQIDDVCLMGIEI